MAKQLTLPQQVQKLIDDRAYLRSTISTLVALANEAEAGIKPAIKKVLQAALDRTANEGEDV